MIKNIIRNIIKDDVFKILFLCYIIFLDFSYFDILPSFLWKSPNLLSLEHSDTQRCVDTQNDIHIMTKCQTMERTMKKM